MVQIYLPLTLAILAQVPTAALSAPRDVAVRSFDGVSLSATYYDPGTPGPGVVIFHNCDGDRRNVDRFARHLSAHGVHVITWDYRAGQAADRPFSDTRASDADRIHDWLVAQPGVDRDRLVGVGGSCGVRVTLDFAERHTPQVKGIVILSGPSTGDQHLFVARTPALAVLGGASRAEGPAVPSIDSVVRASTNRASRMIAPEDGGHGTDMLTRSTEFETEVLTWIAERLALRSSTTGSIRRPERPKPAERTTLSSSRDNHIVKAGVDV